MHEDYNNPNQLSNDIALLKLAESVDLNMYTPACMAAKDADYTGKNGRVYGKGTRQKLLSGFFPLRGGGTPPFR